MVALYPRYLEEAPGLRRSPSGVLLCVVFLLRPLAFPTPHHAQVLWWEGSRAGARNCWESRRGSERPGHSCYGSLPQRVSGGWHNESRRVDG